jgi:cell volume regulation protein A
VLRKLPLPPRLAGMLEGESGLNDPPAVLAVTLLSDIGHHPPSPALIAGEIVFQLAAGAAIGVLAGVLGAQVLRRVALPASGLYPIAILALIVASYGAATLARASGFLAVYVSALVLGNARLPHRPAIRGFAEGVAWLAQIGLFVMLGLLASPARLPAQIIPAIAAGSVLVLAARPAAVVAATLPLRVPWRQQGFLSWAGLRGAVPIVLATIPVNARVPGATRLFDIVFIIVVINTAVQGPTLPWAGRRLKVTTPAEPLDVDVEAAPLEAMHADLLQAQIPPGSRLHGVEIFELRLPAQASIALIVRDGQGFVPSPTTPLRTGDRLLIVASAAVREQTERRLRAVSRAGKLAGWFGEHGRLPGGPGIRLEAGALVLGRPPGHVGKAVGADQAVPPFHRRGLPGGQALDRQGGHPGAQAQQGALLRVGQDRADPLPAGVRADSAAHGELAVERGPGEIHLEQRLGQRGREPRAVQDDGHLVGQAEPLQVDQGLVRSEAEDFGRLLVLAEGQVADDAVLDEALLFDRTEQAVQRAQRLFDRAVPDERPAAPAAFEDALVLQAAHRLPHGVPADAVVLGQLVVAGEAQPELPGGQPAPEVAEDLRPQRQGTVPVDGHGVHVRFSPESPAKRD